MNQAQAFRDLMVERWCDPSGAISLSTPDADGWQTFILEESSRLNAVLVAGNECGAARLGRAIHGEWREVRGDMPASCWQFPDGSSAIIGDDGHWMLPLVAP